MKKNIFAALFLLLASSIVFAAGSSEKESKDLSGKTLNVVATSAYKELRKLLQGLTEKIPLKL